MARHPLSPDTLSDLRRQLAPLPPRSAERRHRIQAAAAFYGVSEPTLYRLLRQRPHPRALGRADRGIPRVLPKAELEPRFRTTHVSLSNFWVPIQSLCKGGDYATLVPP